jgi:hypothetical protein
MLGKRAVACAGGLYRLRTQAEIRFFPSFLPNHFPSRPIPFCRPILNSGIVVHSAIIDAMEAIRINHEETKSVKKNRKKLFVFFVSSWLIL